jgi:hypothetical protein
MLDLNKELTCTTYRITEIFHFNLHSSQRKEKSQEHQSSPARQQTSSGPAHLISDNRYLSPVNFLFAPAPF